MVAWAWVEKRCLLTRDGLAGSRGQRSVESCSVVPWRLKVPAPLLRSQTAVFQSLSSHGPVEGAYRDEPWPSGPPVHFKCHLILEQVV